MADESGTIRKVLPPYVPVKTFFTFIEHLRSSRMPSHIDKDVMRNHSGGMQSWMKASLRSMNLINANDEPTEMLHRLVAAPDGERQALLQELFHTTYAFLEGRLDLQNTTAQKLRAEIIELGAQGTTVEKIVAFLVGLGREAGVPLSPYLTKRASGQRRLRPRSARREPASAAGDEFPRNGGDELVAMKTLRLPHAKGTLTLSGSFNPFDLSGEERSLVYAIIDKMNEFARQQGSDRED